MNNSFLKNIMQLHTLSSYQYNFLSPQVAFDSFVEVLPVLHLVLGFWTVLSVFHLVHNSTLVRRIKFLEGLKHFWGAEEQKKKVVIPEFLGGLKNFRGAQLPQAPPCVRACFSYREQVLV